MHECPLDSGVDLGERLRWATPYTRNVAEGSRLPEKNRGRLPLVATAVKPMPATARMFRSLRRQTLGAALIAASFAASGQGVIPGYPQSVESFDPREIALLPDWCVYTDTFRIRISPPNLVPMLEYWRGRMGPTFDAMHHYCYALMKTNRATLLARDEITRGFYLRDAIRELDYVLANANPGFALLPDILARKGENLIRLGLGSLAVPHLERAIELNPAYWPAYMHMSDHHKRAGDLKEARGWLDKGLAQAPGNAALVGRVEALDTPRRRGTPSK
jgi:hypothetical protein